MTFDQWFRRMIAEHGPALGSGLGYSAAKFTWHARDAEIAELRRLVEACKLKHKPLREANDR